MKISRHSTIVLPDGGKYVMVNACKIDGTEYALISTIPTKNPVEIRVAQLRMNDGKPEIKEYVGKDYKDILFKLLNAKVG